MTLQRQLLNRAAICTAAMIDNQTFKINEDDITASNIEVGDTLHIAITPADIGTDFEPNDRAIFKAPLGPGGMIVLPSDVTDKLNLEAEDKIKFVAIPDKSVPGLDNGPVRDKIRGGGDEEEERERPERVKSEATFQGPKMRQTGQIKVPGEVMDDLGLLPGDDVALLIRYEGNEATQEAVIQKTRDRVSVRKETREQLGLTDSKGAQPEIQIQPLN